MTKCPLCKQHLIEVTSDGEQWLECVRYRVGCSYKKRVVQKTEFCNCDATMNENHKPECNYWKGLITTVANPKRPLPKIVDKQCIHCGQIELYSENFTYCARCDRESLVLYTETEPTQERIKEIQKEILELPGHDPVNHPSHYCSHPSGIECITITRHHDFAVGNAMKYMWRAGLKDSSPGKEIEDLKKAVWYLNDKIAQLEKQNG